MTIWRLGKTGACPYFREAAIVRRKPVAVPIFGCGVRGKKGFTNGSDGGRIVFSPGFDRRAGCFFRGANCVFG